MVNFKSVYILFVINSILYNFKMTKMYLEWIQWRGQTTFGSGEVNRGQRDEH